MEKVFSISKQLGTDVRTRANADAIWDFLKGNASGAVVLDFSDVVFISRSFADEICNITTNFSNVELRNAVGVTKAMIDAVSESRKHKRVRKKDDSEVVDLKDMSSLSSFFAAI